jgi:hypothetical protein
MLSLDMVCLTVALTAYLRDELLLFSIYRLIVGMDAWEGVAMNSLKFHLVLPTVGPKICFWILGEFFSFV